MQTIFPGCSPDSWRGRFILMLSHCAGMIDLVALPVWVGVLVQHYGFDLEHAGMTVTAFLVGAVIASLVVAPRFNRLPRTVCVVAGYAAASAVFLACTMSSRFEILAPLHLLAGIAAGTALSITHGTIGRSAAPHKLFAIVGSALGVGAVAFYASVPPAIGAHGGVTLFYIFSGLMACAAVAALDFPRVADRTGASEHPRSPAHNQPLSRATWCAILGFACMALNQALTFSMLERIGIMRGFSQQQVNALLIVCGLVSLAPAALAGLLEQRLSATRVALTAAPLQAALAVVITLSSDYVFYALAASIYSAVLIFAHTFVFGLIARLDPSGRALASTPAMMMTGSAIGPALAGAVAMRAGFDGQAMLALLVGAAAFVLFSLARKPPPAVTFAA